MSSDDVSAQDLPFADERRAALRRYNILGSPEEAAFNHITRRLTEMLGAETMLQSQEGEGSLFTVMLPWRTGDDGVSASPYASSDAPSDASNETPTAVPKSPPNALPADPLGDPLEDLLGDDASESRSPRGAHTPQSGPHLMLVDDNNESRQVFALLLRQVDPTCRVDLVEDAASALEHAAATAYDGVVIDVDLGPGMDGVALMHRLRGDARHAHVPMMACTAYAMPGDEEQLRSEGFDVYLAKPYRIDDLRTGLDEMWGSGADR